MEEERGEACEGVQFFQGGTVVYRRSFSVGV